ncbi:MAG: cupin domain-containing protein [Dehalococcoidia bacterium]|nr:cupin domain-containing protein [Dehalococcoidia bacterium]
MAEKESFRTKEREAQIVSLHESHVKEAEDRLARAMNGRVVVRGKEMPFIQSRQGLAKHFLDASFTDVAVQGWRMFSQEIVTRSGRHRHQGGLTIYVLQGRGYTMTDGVRQDWEEGDLLLLPIKPGGVDHQHFNLRPDGPSRWLAMIYLHFFDILCSEMVQVENHPDWKE